MKSRSSVDTIFRWWRELFHPSKKCERIGHKFFVWGRKVWVRSRWAVVARATEQQVRCERCGAVKHDWNEVGRTDYTSASWPTSMWD